MRILIGTDRAAVDVGSKSENLEVKKWKLEVIPEAGSKSASWTGKRQLKVEVEARSESGNQPLDRSRCLLGVSRRVPLDQLFDLYI